MNPMPLDDLVLALQRFVDRLVRRAGADVRLPRDAAACSSSRSTDSRAACWSRRWRRGACRSCAGDRARRLASASDVRRSAFVDAFLPACRDVRRAPDIPGFHYHDKRQREDVYFHARATPRAWSARRRAVVAASSRRRLLWLRFHRGALQNLFTFAIMKRPSGSGLLAALSAVIVLLWVALKSTVITVVELARAVLRLLADPVASGRAGGSGWPSSSGSRSGCGSSSRSPSRVTSTPACRRSTSTISTTTSSHTPTGRGIRVRCAACAHRRRDQADLARVPSRAEHAYDLYILSDHGQALCKPFGQLSGGRRFERVVFEDFFTTAEARPVGPERPAGRRRLASASRRCAWAAPPATSSASSITSRMVFRGSSAR